MIVKRVFPIHFYRVTQWNRPTGDTTDKKKRIDNITPWVMRKSIDTGVAPMGHAQFIWYGSEALDAPRPAAGAKTRGGRKEALPPKNGRCVHFSSMPGLRRKVLQALYLWNSIHPRYRSQTTGVATLCQGPHFLTNEMETPTFGVRVPGCP